MKFSTIFTFACTATFAISQAVPGTGVTKKDLGDEVIKALEKALQAGTCGACNTTLAALKVVSLLGDRAFVDALSSACVVLGLFRGGEDVCAGAIRLEGPTLAHDLREMKVPSHTSQLFCAHFLGLCGYPDVVPYTVSFPSPKPAPAGRPAPSGQEPIQIVQYSDIHIDPFYVTGSNTDCGKPVCCRVYEDSDAPGSTSSPAGPFGDYACDVPVSLEESMHTAISEIAPNAAFTTFTGDIVDHAVWNTTQAQNTIDINDAYAKMSARRLVYGTIGNHEASPTNAFPPTSVGDDSDWVYNLLSGIWSRWIGVTAASAEQDFGAYSTKYERGNLRVVSLNTNFYYALNFWMYRRNFETDPSGQLAWLVRELQAAEDVNERVYIIDHTPPGRDDTFRDISNYFDQIMNRYSGTIATLFFGHTYKGHFEIAYSDYSARSYSNALAVSYIMPSLTPTDGHPSFRIYSVDPVTFAILDSTTYIADVTNPGYQTTSPVWTKYYSAKEAYSPLISETFANDTSAELAPAFWHNVTAALQSNPDAFSAYYARKTRGWEVPACDDVCKVSKICQLQANAGAR
ncbi:hypothetical protein LTS18_004828 [Coniosporium uncinatum]|uniref:Uncharacterized protein n=1 Tax=Coniosporium uncinatum TaxID=93489 RepID=A0ACC3D593_9PEZI|nr:hypothetical protein LTS18_004828 [Coniosporium uncinatum]